MTVPLTFTVRHSLGKEEAKRRISTRFSELSGAASGFNVTGGAWSRDVFPLTASGLGQTVTGQIEAFDTAVRITIDVPHVLAPMAKVAMAVMRNKTRLLLD